MKEVSDEVEFLRADKLESFLQMDTDRDDMILIGMVKDSKVPKIS